MAAQLEIQKSTHGRPASCGPCAALPKSRRPYWWLIVPKLHIVQKLQNLRQTRALRLLSARSGAGQKQLGNLQDSQPLVVTSALLYGNRGKRSLDAPVLQLGALDWWCKQRAVDTLGLTCLHDLSRFLVSGQEEARPNT